MSDLPQRPGGNDRVRDTLTALRGDTERVPLHDASAVRRRGQARTRHQVVATAAAAFVLVAGVVTGGTLLSGNDGTQAPVATKGSTSSPTATTVQEGLDPKYLLAADDLPGQADGYPDYALAKSDATADDAADSSCLTGLTVANAVTGGRSFTAPAGPYPQTTVNVVYQLASADAAGQAEAGINQYLLDCGRRLADSTFVEGQALGDGHDFEHSMSKPDVQDAVPHESLLVIRYDRFVSVTSLMAITQDASAVDVRAALLEKMGAKLGKKYTVAADPVLLKASDLPTGQGDGVWADVPKQDAGLYSTDTCLPAYDGAAFERLETARFTGPQDATTQQAGVQWVYVAKDAAGAASTFTDAVDQITGCTAERHPELSGPVTMDEKLVGTRDGVQRVYLQMTVGDVHQRIAVGQVGKVVTAVVLQRTKTAGTDEAQLETTLESAIELLRPYAEN